MTAPKLQRWSTYHPQKVEPRDDGTWYAVGDVVHLLAIVEAAAEHRKAHEGMERLPGVLTSSMRCPMCIAVRAAREKGVIQ